MNVYIEKKGYLYNYVIGIVRKYIPYSKGYQRDSFISVLSDIVRDKLFYGQEFCIKETSVQTGDHYTKGEKKVIFVSKDCGEGDKRYSLKMSTEH